VTDASIEVNILPALADPVEAPAPEALGTEAGTNPYIAAMLPALPGPVETTAPEALGLYIEALDMLAQTPGPLGDEARKRATAVRPVVEHQRTRARPVWKAGGPVRPSRLI
jgi:hypothetical protein